jgi:hypothetical protein
VAKNNTPHTEFVNRKGKDLVPPFQSEERSVSESKPYQMIYTVRDKDMRWVATTCTAAMAHFLAEQLNKGG